MTAKPEILEGQYWDRQYRSPRIPWDTGRPSRELQRVLAEQRVEPCRAVEFGCGTGANVVWLASRGFDVTGIDLSPKAVARARRRAFRAGVTARVIGGNLLDPEILRGPFDFFFDRGCYHAVRLADRAGYIEVLRRLTRPGSVGLVLTGNADEPEDPNGPPVMTERELRRDFGGPFEVVRLRAFRFDAPRREKAYLGWSCFLRRMR